MLELKAISKAFGAIVVASDIDLTLSSGEALGVIGPNGAGKSSLFNLITGMVRPDSGRIILDGNDITHLPPEARCRAGIGRSFQIPLPFEHLSVFENLSVAALFGGGLSEAEAYRSAAGRWHSPDLKQKPTGWREACRCSTVSGWSWRGRSPPVRARCCSMKLPAGSPT